MTTEELVKELESRIEAGEVLVTDGVHDYGILSVYNELSDIIYVDIIRRERLSV